MSTSGSSFDAIGHLKTSVSDSLRRLARTLELLDRPDATTRPLKEATDIDGESFTIVTAGHMQRGKSTLVNALLGQHLLPIGRGPACTAIPISIHWGESRSGTAYRVGDGAGEPFEPTAAAIEDRARLRHGPDAANGVAERIKIAGPFPICSNWVSLQDTPGFDEDDDRTAITWDLVEEADAAIFVLSVTQTVLQSEINNLKEVLTRAMSPQSVFVAWNHFDRERRSDPNAMREYQAVSDQKVRALGIPSSNIFFLSAKEALASRAATDQHAFRESGFAAFEERVATFLVQERSRTKLSNGISTAVWALDVATQAVATKSVDGWSTPDRDTRELATRARDKALRAIQVRDFLTRQHKKTVAAARKTAAANAEELVSSLLEGVKDQIEGTPVTFGQVATDGKQTRQRLADLCSQWVTTRSKRWEREVLLPVIADGVTTVKTDVKQGMIEVESIADELRSIRREYTRRLATNSAEDMHFDDAVESDAATVKYKSSVEVDLSGVSCDDSTKGSLVTSSLIGGGVAVAAGAAVVGIVFLPFAVAGAAVGAVLAAVGAVGRLKRDVKELIQQSLRDNNSTIVDTAVSATEKKLRNAIKSLEHENHRLFEEIATNASAIASAQASLEHLRATRQGIVSQARSEIEDIAFVISDAESTINPAIDPEALVDRIVEKLRTSAPLGETTVESKVTPNELRRLLAEAAESVMGPDPESSRMLDGIEALPDVKRFWKPAYRVSILALWQLLDRKADPKYATRGRIPAWRSVTALAVIRELEFPPMPEDKQVIEGWLDDEVVRDDLFTIYEIIAGGPHPCDGDQIDPRTGQLFKDPRGTFLKSYARACVTIGYDGGRSSARHATVADPKDH